ncbi:MAG: elongator complex protein 3 [Lentimicrobium sp.]
MKHFTIPIFVPELACPNRCVFCNQHSISGCRKQPEPEEVREIILQHLATIPEKNSHIEIGFFGGSFTGIEPGLQEKYLAVANEFLIPTPRWLSGAETTGNQDYNPGPPDEPELGWSRLPPTTVNQESSQGPPDEPELGWSRLRSTTGNPESNPSYIEESKTRWSSGAETTPDQKRIHGIRLSTRPDYINTEALELLKRYGVTTIELGAQSLSDEVLKLSGRGHAVADVEKASEMILSAGFNLGLQMMTGLPGDTAEKSLQTARRIVDLGASCTRIYPTLVIQGTELEQRWRSREYQPQSLETAVELAARLLDIFREGGVEVIRVGLHPSEGLLDGSEMLAGPFHPSFRELVETFIWKQKLIPLLQQHPAGSNICIPVPADELRNAIGYASANRIMLEKHFSKVEFIPEAQPGQERRLIITDKKLPLPAKNALKTIGELQTLENHGFVYKSISGHPDIFMCQGAEGLVVAPGLPEGMVEALHQKGISVITGNSNPGKVYPESARFNAVVTGEFIIHNLKITDPAIFRTFPGRRHLHVNQGYTRCNLLVLNDDYFITSDRGIEKALTAEGKTVLFVDPSPVKLKGQKYGFFPGCCGLYDDEVLINGSLKHHPQEEIIGDFIKNAGYGFTELYNGLLMDVGGIFVFGD